MCCNESSNLLISLIATKCISRWGNSGDKWWESWGVLTIVKISPCGEKALLKMRYLSFDFWLVSFPQKLILQLNFLPEFTFTRAITESRKLQQFAKKINCLDFMKTCIIFVWSKILLLSLKTFCLLNSDVPSIMKELRCSLILPQSSRIFLSLYYGAVCYEEIKMQSKGKTRESLIWLERLKKWWHPCQICEGSFSLKVITSWINSHPISPV